jgi:hypothetical protein
MKKIYTQPPNACQFIAGITVMNNQWIHGTGSPNFCKLFTLHNGKISMRQYSIKPDSRGLALHQIEIGGSLSEDTADQIVQCVIHYFIQAESDWIAS